MIAEQVSRRYSKALFDAAKSPEQMQRALDSLKALVDVFEKDMRFRKLLLSPHLSHKEQQSLLHAISEAIGADAQVLGFLQVLLKKKRLMYLPEIVQAFRRRVKQKLGVVDALVTTAAPMDEATRSTLKMRLEVFNSKKMTLSEEVDPRILGGAIVVADRRMVDFSVRTRLNKLQMELLSIRLP